MSDFEIDKQECCPSVGPLSGRGDGSRCVCSLPVGHRGPHASGVYRWTGGSEGASKGILRSRESAEASSEHKGMCHASGPYSGHGPGSRYVCTRQKGHEGLHGNGSMDWGDEVALEREAALSDLRELEENLTRVIYNARDAVVSMVKLSMREEPVRTSPVVMYGLWVVIGPDGSLCDSTFSASESRSLELYDQNYRGRLSSIGRFPGGKARRVTVIVEEAGNE